MNKLYFGDNLEIMHEMESGHIDLICTDPPFNSGRNYNAFFKESKAQSKAFTDIWQWDEAAIESRDDIRSRVGGSDTYKALDACLRGYDLVLQNAVKGNKGSMRAYLAFMSPRLAEMHRLLRDTGSIYLHCDPTASHYLKGVMDAIWDQNNRKDNDYYRNEIVWGYKTGGTPKVGFARKHDIILYYTKSKSKFCFNHQKQKSYVPTLPEPHTASGQNLNVLRDDLGKYREVIMRDWWVDTGLIPEDDISSIYRNSPEYLPFPTQKPLALYKRMIEVSSDEGMLVMDPFCGCGTTIDVAHMLKRNWIGIDLTIIALDPISKRMRDRHVNSDNEPLEPHKDYEIIGYPTNMQEVQKLVRNEKKRHDFSNWAVTRLGMIPTRDTRDGGKDGIGHVMLWNPEQKKATSKRIISEVKTGKPTISEVRAFCHTINEQDAVAGVFITLEPITSGMRQIAANMGEFELENNKYYPRLVFWQIDDAYFDNPNSLKDIIRLPYNWIEPRKKSDRHFDHQQLGIL